MTRKPARGPARRITRASWQRRVAALLPVNTSPHSQLGSSSMRLKPGMLTTQPWSKRWLRFGTPSSANAAAFPSTTRPWPSTKISGSKRSLAPAIPAPYVRRIQPQASGERQVGQRIERKGNLSAERGADRREQRRPDAGRQQEPSLIPAPRDPSRTRSATAGSRSRTRAPEPPPRSRPGSPRRLRSTQRSTGPRSQAATAATAGIAQVAECLATGGLRPRSTRARRSRVRERATTRRLATTRAIAATTNQAASPTCIAASPGARSSRSPSRTAITIGMIAAASRNQIAGSSNAIERWSHGLRPRFDRQNTGLAVLPATAAACSSATTGPNGADSQAKSHTARPAVSAGDRPRYLRGRIS